MLFLADLSGIQDYLFLVRETGGKQASALRFRSLYIQLIAEALAVRILHACDLTEEAIVFNAAGKIAIQIPDIDGSLQTIQTHIREIEELLRRDTQARLSLSYAVSNGNGHNLVHQFDDANRRIQRAKLQRWSSSVVSNAWDTSALVMQPPPDTESEADRDARFGRNVVQPDRRFVVFGRPEAADHTADLEVLGLPVHLVSTLPSDPSLHTRNLDRLARHIPTQDNHAVEFVDLAHASSGMPMLGVLKADADSLGAAISGVLQGACDLDPLQKLSQRLEHFFSENLDQRMRHDSRWSQLYTVFSGGDDVLLVGPWDIALDFADFLREAFVSEFHDIGLTISAGLAIVKPRFPIRLAVEQAEALLEHAKQQPAPGQSVGRDQFAALGTSWKWSDHQRVIDNGKQLTVWSENRVIHRGWLQTLLRFMQCDDNPMTAARMAYHIARNWPKADSKQPAERDARQMADDLCDLIDQPHNPAAQRAAASLRYALLATRHSSET